MTSFFKITQYSLLAYQERKKNHCLVSVSKANAFTTAPLSTECLARGQFIDVVTRSDSLTFRKRRINAFRSRQIRMKCK